MSSVNKKIHYTAGAQAVRNEIAQRVSDEIDRALMKRKAIFGEETVEVTASDLHDLARGLRIEFEEYEARRRRLRELILSLYAILGVAMTLAGLAYDRLATWWRQPAQGALVLAGSVIVAIVFVMRSMLSGHYRGGRGRDYSGGWERPRDE